MDQNQTSSTVQEKSSKLRKIEELSVPNFLKKTYEILDDDDYEDIVCWNDSGDSIIIKDPTAFCEKVLPVFFKHSNLTSFIRQLNMYDFRKKKNQDYEHVFTHDLFREGNRDSLLNIKRKVSENHTAAVQKPKNTASINAKNANNTNINQENQILKSFHKDQEQRVTLLEAKVFELTGQNQVIYNELQRKIEEQMKNIIKTLLHSSPSYSNHNSMAANYNNDNQTHSALYMVPQNSNHGNYQNIQQVNFPRYLQNGWPNHLTGANQSSNASKTDLNFFSYPELANMNNEAGKRFSGIVFPANQTNNNVHNLSKQKGTDVTTRTKVEHVQAEPTANRSSIV